ncbi:hypothetical protein OPT61_g3471 [Boeremia exigua]|uniref:Uncharacterized protein n=1 Tax=Boeremia exigua TaxID=749465 RepID=A0ACC2IHY7_9PLEO|nr:hypothetical protein OPT61_g3471 [Boeremia exigua]
MSKQTVFTKNAPPTPPYMSQGLIYTGVIHCSGSIAFKPGTTKVLSGGIKAETRQILENLSAVLEEAGSSLADVIKINVFITSMDDFQAMNEVYNEYFSKFPQKPCRTCVGVYQLALGAKVEMDCSAVLTCHDPDPEASIYVLASTDAMPNIVVIGAGVSGLTSAYLLSKNKSNTVAVVAKHMPGDYDIEYASPWAGANFSPMASKENSRWETQTWPYLKKLATSELEAGIHFQRNRIYRRQKDLEKIKHSTSMLSTVFAENPWFTELVDEFRDLETEELPSGIASGSEFKSVCINPALYLPWLVGQCRANGVTFHRRNLAHITDAHYLKEVDLKAQIIVNSTGLSAMKLGGVMDQTMFPIRGQTVIVRNVAPTMVMQSGTDDGDDQACYMMTRAAGGGTILGGTLQVGNWESQPDLNIANRIMKRAVSIAPELTEGKGAEHLDVIRHGVGLRPARRDGLRLEKEKIDGVWVVHNYGHAGWGYQASYGCAEEVVRLVDSIPCQAKL